MASVTQNSELELLVLLMALDCGKGGHSITVIKHDLFHIKICKTSLVNSRAKMSKSMKIPNPLFQTHFRFLSTGSVAFLLLAISKATNHSEAIHIRFFTSPSCACVLWSPIANNSCQPNSPAPKAAQSHFSKPCAAVT